MECLHVLTTVCHRCRRFYFEGIHPGHEARSQDLWEKANHLRDDNNIVCPRCYNLCQQTIPVCPECGWDNMGVLSENLPKVPVPPYLGWMHQATNYAWCEWFADVSIGNGLCSFVIRLKPYTTTLARHKALKRPRIFAEIHDTARYAKELAELGFDCVAEVRVNHESGLLELISFKSGRQAVLQSTTKADSYAFGPEETMLSPGEFCCLFYIVYSWERAVLLQP